MRTEFGVTIQPTATKGVWKVSRKGQKPVLLVQPNYEISLGIQPTIDQAFSVLNNAR